MNAWLGHYIIREDNNMDSDARLFSILFRELAEDIQRNSAAHGFWYEEKKRNKAEMIALMHSELSEALEAIRNPDGLPDKHCPEYSNLEIELADCVIRIMDFAHGFELDLAGAILAKHKFNVNRPYKHGKTF